MSRGLAALLLLVSVLPGRASAEQRLPDCKALSALWISKFRPVLKPRWPAKELACTKSDAQLTAEDIRDIDTARAAYYLSSTEWTRGGALMFSAPLVPGGGLSAPPDMLRWVGRRLKGGLEYDLAAQNAYADQDKGILHLTAGDFRLESGVGLAGQLIHEARHVGIPAYGHVPCTVPGQGSGPNCDPTIAEDFDGGGSHAVAAIWLAWIANRSTWPLESRRSAEGVVVWVLKNRINDTHAADEFACRYLGRYVWNAKAKCR